jgi:hypothetical protein
VPGQGDGYGLLPDYPDAIVARLTEEHGIVDAERCARKPEIGERLSRHNHAGQHSAQAIIFLRLRRLEAPSVTTVATVRALPLPASCADQSANLQRKIVSDGSALP